MRQQVKLTPSVPRKSVSPGFDVNYLGVHNLTPYPIYISYSANAPDANSYDFIVPAATVMTTPLPANQSYSFFMDTSGVVVTFNSPPCVITLDEEPINYGFSQVHLTYPFSSNLQFLARTQQADAYANLSVLSGATVSAPNIIVPSGALYVIKEVRARVMNATGFNACYVQVLIKRVSGLYTTLFYHYFSANENGIWKVVQDLTVVCPHIGPTWDVLIIARNFSGSTVRFQAKIKIDIVQAALP